LSEFSSVPNEISHRDLNTLFLAAIKELKETNINNEEGLNTKQAEFQTLLSDWSKLSKKLLTLIKEKDPFILDNLSQKQAMALGGLEVHLALSLQAKLAVDVDE